jgi:hypothetical protein
MRLNGLSCAELAERARVGARTVRRARDGAPLAGRVALALSKVTGLPVADLLTGS